MRTSGRRWPMYRQPDRSRHLITSVTWGIATDALIDTWTPTVETRDGILFGPYVSGGTRTIYIQPQLSGGASLLTATSAEAGAMTYNEGTYTCVLYPSGRHVSLVALASNGLYVDQVRFWAQAASGMDATARLQTCAVLMNDLSPHATFVFDAETFSYDLDIVNAETGVKIQGRAMGDYDGSTVTCEGTSLSKTETRVIAISAGEEKEINIVVTAIDTETTKEYIITVTRAAV